MSALLLAAALAGSTWCDSVTDVARATIAAREAGVPRAVVAHAAEEMGDDGAQRAALAVTWYVYDANADRRIPPARLLLLIHSACLSDVPNAMQEYGR